MDGIDSEGWLCGVSRCPSDNYNDRPPEEVVSLLVIHNISLPAGQFGTGYVEQLFTNTLDCDCLADFDDLRELRVSAHFLIDRKGTITQFVSLNKRAWHAGVSSFEQRENCNDFSVGVELEGTDHTPYTEAQYQRLAELTRTLLDKYPQLTRERIVGHSDIAPGRKTDPGPIFDWTRFLASLD